MPACIALLSQATLSLWFTHTCVERTRFMSSKSFGSSFGAAVGGALQPSAIEHDRRNFSLGGYKFELVPARFEDRHCVGRKSGFETQLVRQPLMMEAREIDSLLDIH